MIILEVILLDLLIAVGLIIAVPVLIFVVFSLLRGRR